MIASLIHICIRHRILLLLLTAALALVGVATMRRITVDAIPDLSEVQVIIRTDYPGQAPQIVEDQVTYPLTTAMLAVPGAHTVRGFSMYGSSFVYVIFEDHTDLYWARARVLEQLSTIAARLPAGTSPQLGPDATGVGWVYQYMILTGPYSPLYPQGLWQDPQTDRWFGSPQEAEDSQQAQRLVHHRILPADMQDCPISGQALKQADLSLADLRSLQDWHLRYELTAVRGVSEVASVGGMVRQYQVTVDPLALQAHNLGLTEVRDALRMSNQEVGGRSLERAGKEYMIRSPGYLGNRPPGTDEYGSSEERVLRDLAKIVLALGEDGMPVTLNDVASIESGPEMRRGIAEWNGEGESVGGIVVMRAGEDALRTIAAVEERIQELLPSLPPGVAIVTAYDRSDLINRAISTLSSTLIEQILVVSLVLLVFLFHARSALVAALVLPCGVLGALILMHMLAINANIMSLGGIAIAIGVMVDSAIVMVENAHRALEEEEERVAAGETARSRTAIISQAAAEVGPTLFFSLLIITVSFLPIFLLSGQSGRLFTPLAYTKTFAMGVAAVIAVTLIPVVMTLCIGERVLPAHWSRSRQILVALAIVVFPALLLATAPLDNFLAHRSTLVIVWLVISLVIVLPQRIYPQQRNPLIRCLQALYESVFTFAIRFRYGVLLAALGLVALTWYPLSRSGWEFMPPLEEGDFLYMPNTDPGLSITAARELLQQSDALIRQFPEVASVMGKIGRADTATDPAPLSMIETTIVLERDRSRWRQVPDSWLWGLIRFHRPITLEELTDGYTLPGGARVPGINDALRIPGLTGALTRGAMPIRTRIDMLATGIRTPIGVKIMGPDLDMLDHLTQEVEQALRADTSLAARTASIASDRVTGGSYLSIIIDRLAIQRYGLHVATVQEHILAALGGATVSWTVEGIERYPVNLRFARELREDIEQLQDILVRSPSGAQIPLAELAGIEEHGGPPMIKSENARPTSWLYITPRDSDLSGFVTEAREVLARNLDLPSGYSLAWSGQFEHIAEARERFTVVIPLTILAIILLLYLATGSWIQVGIVLLLWPFSIIGAFWAIYLLDYQFSVAVVVGMIALAGLDVENSLVMLHYLRDASDQARKRGELSSPREVWRAVHAGAVQRIAPKSMTVITDLIALLPLLWAVGAGSDTMRRLAAPMLGGLLTSTIAELILYPIAWYIIQRRQVSTT